MALPSEDDDAGWLQMLRTPAVMVNSFRIKNPHRYSDRYIYVPGDSFRLPGEHSQENVDGRTAFPGQKYVTAESETYVPLAPAFMAWPVGTQTLRIGDVDAPLFEFRSVKARGQLGRRIVQASTAPDDPSLLDLPGFCAPRSEALGSGLLYEHKATMLDGRVKYTYDFVEHAHDDWGKGEAVCYVMPVPALVESLNRAAGDAPPKSAIVDALTSPETVRTLAQLSAGALAPGKTVADQTIENMISVFQGKGLPVRAFTLGASFDIGLGLTGAIERGALFNLNKKPIHTYTTLSGGISAAAGATVNLCLGFWWGESEAKVLGDMQGRGEYMYVGFTYGAGLNIIVSFASSGLPIGLTISPQLGPELEAGVGMGATYTSFYEPPPHSYMRMPTGFWG